MVRVRFAPSPTGTLHIGGVRTALYNYLLARQTGGRFILRIEDTDQTRFVPGAEEYIIEALRWVGLVPDEGVGFGGEYGPYRQSDRKAIYHQYALELIERGHAYYAFDTPEELEAKRSSIENFTYNCSTRGSLRNSLTLPEAEVKVLLEQNVPSVIRLKIEPGQRIVIQDLIRGEVQFQSDLLDDKVLLKADGMPTYHLANIVDDHLMKISHVIRGEEWLSSTAHHVLLYRGLGWEDTMPVFAHLPLILKPVGDGKLSKRDGAKFGFPVFPLSWDSEKEEERAIGFREAGFLPEAVVNFLALLGWHPEDEQEIFSMEQLVTAFSLEKINKGGARFDYEKAKWFNQKYIQATDNKTLAQLMWPSVKARQYDVCEEYLEQVAALMKERVTFLHDFVEQGHYLFETVTAYDEEALSKKWKASLAPVIERWIATYEAAVEGNAVEQEDVFKAFVSDQGIKPGELLPLLRLALAGTMKGPGVFELAATLGKEETLLRLNNFLKHCLNLESA